LLLIIPKINTVKNIYTFLNTRYRYLVLGKNGLKYSVLGKTWYSVQPQFKRMVSQLLGEELLDILMSER